ncbi:MAG TPA: hypothetical protein PKA63_13920 [Oligoflexia bacterium]|nr:hypothetical protein [Oligoflexia bacterium]HMP49761.1 hypothetical protein [Oligoflexia bacterium]
MDKNIASAFKRIEKKLENERKEALRQERLKELQKEREEAEKKRLRREILTYAAILIVLFAIAYLISTSHFNAKTQGKTFTAYMRQKFVDATGISNGKGIAEPVCDKPETWRLPECVDKRRRDTESSWKDLSLEKGGNPTAFSINGKK